MKIVTHEEMERINRKHPGRKRGRMRITLDGLKAIPEFPGYYADQEGSIWSTVGRIGINELRQSVSKNKSCRVQFCRDGVFYRRIVARVILETYVGPCPPGMEACHDPNYDPRDNRLSNLRWDTRKANQLDCVRHGRKPSKLTISQATEIRRRYTTGETQTTLAKEYGVSQSTVWRILQRKTWDHCT